MSQFRYLVVGGGMTGDAACRGIRDRDREGAIVLVGSEPHAPYARPPLSKALWKGKDESSIWRGTEELGVVVRTARTIVSLTLDEHVAVDDTGERYAYEKILLATGGTPRTLSSPADGVVYYRTLDDFRRVREAAGEGVRAAVVGGGFIGSEIAAALALVGCTVTIVFPGEAIGGAVFPRDLALAVNEHYREQGVDVRPDQRVTSVGASGSASVVETESGLRIEVDLVVAGLGIEPETDLAAAAGLPVDDGIVVDELGRVGGRNDVFAAGDAARFPIAALGGTRRVEHEDHANTHGRHVGANMAGASEPYDHLPFFYSDLFDLGYEAVGDVDARLRTVAEWAEPNRKGVVGYVDDGGRARGFLLWDVWGQVDEARALVRAGEPLRADALRALLD